MRRGDSSRNVTETRAECSDIEDVDSAFGRALELAAIAGRFDVVSQLARELEARRLTRMGNVVPLRAKTHQRGE